MVRVFDRDTFLTYFVVHFGGDEELYINSPTGAEMAAVVRTAFLYGPCFQLCCATLAVEGEH